MSKRKRILTEFPKLPDGYSWHVAVQPGGLLSRESSVVVRIVKSGAGAFAAEETAFRMNQVPADVELAIFNAATWLYDYITSKIWAEDQVKHFKEQYGV